MRHAHPLAPALLVLTVLVRPAGAVVAIAGLEGVPQTATAPTPEPRHDPLERTTLRGALAAFLRAVARDDFVSAARYMQEPERRPAENEPRARALKALIDRYFSQALTSISDAPAGALDDGLPLDRERIGPLAIEDQKADVTLVRVTAPEVGPIWLISAETLAQAPVLYRSLGRSWIERTMPESLVDRKLFGLSLAQWLAVAAGLAVPFLLLTLISAIGVLVGRRVFRRSAWKDDWKAWHAGLRWPAIGALSLAAQLVAMRFLALPLTFRLVYARLALGLMAVALALLLRRALALGFARARGLAKGREHTSTRSLMLLGERLAQALVIAAAALAILIIAGVDTKAAFASLGVAGVVLALGAQKTVENLLGGVFLLTDRALAVGDLCSVANRLGWVEDITLRSVRLRTVDNSVVSVPAGVLAQAAIENFATRGKILAQHVLRLRHGTSAGPLRLLLSDIRRRLEADAKIEPGARIHLVQFGAEAIELELFAYVTTDDYLEFLTVREALLLDIAGLVESAGSAFAMPTQFIYMAGTRLELPLTARVGLPGLPEA